MMSKATKKKLLIEEDKALLKAICKDVSQYTPKLKELQKNYDALQLVKFNNKVLKELINEGSSGIIAKYHESLERQLNALKIKSTVMRSNLITEHNVFIENLEGSLLELISFCPFRFKTDFSPTLELKYISFDNNSFGIVKEDIETLTEIFCRTYLINDTEIRAWKAINKLNDSYREFKDVLGEIGYSSFRGFESMHMYIKDTRIPEVKPKEIKSIFNYVNREKAYEQSRIDRQS